MKRDLNLVREILLKMEEHDRGYAPDLVVVPEYTDEQVGYHCHLMGQAGLIKTFERTTLGLPSPMAEPVSITWLGYEFLSAARDETLWKKTKETVLSPGAGIAFSVLLEYLKQKGLESLGLS